VRVIIQPYDVTFNRMGIEDRRGWSKLVQKQMDLIWLRGGTAILLELSMGRCRHCTDRRAAGSAGDTQRRGF
jgi:hypothetical protein